MPTDEEALVWAEAGKRHARRSLCQLLHETPLDKKPKPSPETAVAAGQQPALEEAAIAAMPFNAIQSPMSSSHTHISPCVSPCVSSASQRRRSCTSVRLYMWCENIVVLAVLL